mmetsp:Transcript_11275/g.18420  ORF Transcript_11275/g.18420 Transcript_11275/m.18420 type:complete len:275 (-) Transcript_11275:92-916(-)|eukprot:CAMPEP_0184656132 /NCGR_PEP_ID=MMETSP0308-20130426/15718_1 /TAXON_ID=38269 /ORGANISM="Gloeochaete witrockiana, Strain SAG 46.84" /LENGTH=274 /DNA_ID=CAMNT_0027093087 /DNA_START=163 /DNA_END=987 /DNA_ORIENTATION=-
MADERTYTEEEKAKYEAFRTALDDITPHQKAWADEACLYRYLRARSFDLTKAEAMIRETLKWREESHPESIKFQDIAHEVETGKVYFRGSDKVGHPILIMRPVKQNTSERAGQMKLLVYMLEECIRHMGPGIEKLVLITDFKGYSMRNAPDMGTSRETLHILSNHYPERLLKSFSVDPPWYFWVFFKLIKPFIDPVTLEKVVFIPDNNNSCEPLYQVVDKSKLEKTLMGDDSYEFNFEEYRAEREKEEELRAEKLKLEPLTPLDNTTPLVAAIS